MIKNKLTVLALLFLPLLSFAHSIDVNKQIIKANVNDKGELLYKDKEFSYRKWDSSQLVGKVRVLQHIAGRTAAKEINAPLIEAIKLANLPHDRYQTTTIVNTDDAISLTGTLVLNKLKGSKREFPWAQFIVDSKGIVKKTWNLSPESSAIVVLDKNGIVKFVKDGRLTQEEIKNIMQELQQLVKE